MKWNKVALCASGLQCCLDLAIQINIVQQYIMFSISSK